MATGWLRSSGTPNHLYGPAIKRACFGTETADIEFENVFLGHRPKHLPQVQMAKVFQDPVHGPIKLDPLLVSIIDTPQFQRLRDLKQLGLSYWVYPGGCHNRFEHCIGTSHLCGLMITTLRDLHQREYMEPVEISDTDVLCIKIAGLCHDLGHGPFSHVFDNMFIKKVDPDSKWSHEQASCDMFDYMLADNPDLQFKFRERGIGENEVAFIKRLIMGCDPRKEDIPELCKYRGQTVQKWFLYEIVANKRTGIDCDKFDYFARDSHFVGVRTNFDCMRFFQNLRVIAVDGQLQICVRDKEVFNLYEMFHVRWTLHHQVYQHKTTKCIEQMIVEALAKVDKRFGISASIYDMSKYLYMTDSLVYQILRDSSNDPDLQEAQDLLRRVQRRDLYKFCGQLNPSCDRDELLSLSQPVFLDAEIIAAEIAEFSPNLHPRDVFINIAHISFGMKHKNPIESLVFFTKNGQPLLLRPDQISALLPKTFNEQFIRVFARSEDRKPLVERCFAKWCEEKGYHIPSFLSEFQSGCFSSQGKEIRMIEEKRKERTASLIGNKRVRRSLMLLDSDEDSESN